MSKYNKEWPTVFTDDFGNHSIMTPKGEVLNGVVLTRVTDDCEAFPEVMVKMFCNIAKDHEDAMSKYRQLEEEEARSK
jgi:hypothetical protein